MTLTCRSQWITMPGHTINKLLTPPDFLKHTPVPHVEKSSHACRKTSDHLHAVKSVIDYSVREPHFSKLTSATIFWEIYGNMAWSSKMCLMRSESWSRRNLVVKLMTLAWIRHYYSSIQIRTKNRCCLSVPNNRHRLCYHGNADALEKCSLPQLKHIILEGEAALLI